MFLHASGRKIPIFVRGEPALPQLFHCRHHRLPDASIYLSLTFSCVPQKRHI